MAEALSKTKVIMLGGRRTGKSTILSTLIHSLNAQSSKMFMINERYDKESSGMQVPLHVKRIEIDNYLRKRQKFGNNSQFIVDMSPSEDQAIYNLEVSVQNAANIMLECVDVPGEWMNPQNRGEYSTLCDHVRTSDVFIIAIDTPFLMQEDNPNINTVWNRIEEITNLISEMRIEDSKDSKMIIFAPVKCEKWVNEGRIDEVTEAVKNAYRVMINHWVDHPAVAMWVMPIITAGGIEHTRMLDGYRFFRTPQDKKGEICSIEPYSGMLMLKDGKTILESMIDAIDSDPDQSLNINYTQIPLSWYKTNDKGFQPQLCEQVAYHTLRFLVEKEKVMASLKYDEYRSKNWFWRIFSSGGRFGRYLTVYSDLVKQLPIKCSGNGFQKIDSQIP